MTTSNLQRIGIPSIEIWHSYRIGTISVVLFTAFVFLLSYTYRLVQQDDAYIFYTYAERIYEGHEWAFNAGEPTYATTSALYTTLLAVVYGVLNPLSDAVTMPVAGHIIGAIALWYSAYAGMRLLRRDGLRIAAAVFPFVLLVNPLLRDGVGMETFLTLALILLSLSLYQERRYMWFGAAAGVAVLSRPDAILVPALLSLDYVLRERRLPPLPAIGMFVLVLMPWLLFTQFSFGSVLPQTLGAKLGQTESGRWGTGLLYLNDLITQLTSHWTFLLMTVATLGGLAYLLFNRAWLRHRMAVLLVSWGGLYLLAYTILNPPGYVWYFTPLALGSATILAVALELFYRQIASHYISPIYYTASIIVASSAAILVAMILQFDRPVTAKYENYARAADWLNANAHEGASVGAHEIGVIGYYYEHGPIIDAAGLVTPNVARYVAEQDYTRYIHEYEPDFIMTDYPPRPVLEAKVNEDWFNAMYQKAVVIDTGRRAVAIYQRTP